MKPSSCDTSSSVIFYAFTEDNVVVKPVPEMRAPLHIGMDFNIDPMSAVVCYKGANSLHIIDEIEIWSSNTLRDGARDTQTLWQ